MKKIGSSTVVSLGLGFFGVSFAVFCFVILRHWAGRYMFVLSGALSLPALARGIRECLRYNTKSLAVMLAALSFSVLLGCGTMLATLKDGDGPHTPTGLYPGVRADASMLHDVWTSKDEVDRSMEWLTPFLVIDFPLSAVADTLRIPVYLKDK